MTSDEVKKAIRSYRAGRERLARGTVDGYRVYLIKKRGLFRWTFIIEVDGSREYAKSGDKEEIETDFRHYKEQYDLNEVDTSK